MYYVVHQGKLIATFVSFVDAWLHAFFLKSFSNIFGPDGQWVVNPPRTN